MIEKSKVIFDHWQQTLRMPSLRAVRRVEFHKSGLLQIISAQADTFVGRILQRVVICGQAEARALFWPWLYVFARSC